MVKRQKPEANQLNTPEKASRVLRDFNALGAVAIGAAAILAPPGANVALASWAGINAAQAGGFEWLRRKAKRNRERSSNK
jgi:hypothetical protein